MDEPRDVVVIGGGIVGVSTALFLAERGMRVSLCEKGRVAGEQSSRNWGFVRQMGRDPVELPLAVRSLELWRGLGHRFDAETGFRETGILYTTRSEKKAADLARWSEIGRELGVHAAVLDKAGVSRFVGHGAHPYVMGLHTASDGRAEPGMATAALARAAARLGAQIRENTAVRGVETAAGRVTGVVTEHGVIPCAAVVVAAGMWSRRFLRPLGVDFPQLPLIASVARIETPAPLPALPFAADDWAFRHREDGGYTLAMRNTNIADILPDSFRLMRRFMPSLKETWREVRLRFGAPFFRALRDAKEWPMDMPSPFEAMRVLDPAPHIVHARDALKSLEAVFPAARGARITHDWGGVIDATPDALPVIGATGPDGMFLASGFSGHGFGIGPGAGEMMADLVMGRAPKMNAAPFGFARFSR